ncbi:MAG TPA: heavy metal translocating P-type ATPase, partial [Woeseiaceae bacterium]|nr:heavy metal translocating P-type ATPase [Woeseiaceae bacterium]
RHVGAETTTARIARFIDDSLEQSSETQRMAERLADRRVKLTLGTGGLVYLLTRDERRLASIFLVDYSCALKLGTPLAFRSGMYRAATDGVLLKGGEAIEQLAAVDTVVFDKTGTLTHSDLEVSDVVVLDEERWPRNRLLAVTASIEEHATHPIADAIVRKAREERLNHIDHGEVDYLVAHGMSCPVNGDTLLIGSRHYLEEHEGISFERFERRIRTLEADGKTLLYIGTRTEAIGLIALRDTLREDAAGVIDALRELGIEHFVMLTGDRRTRAEALARQVGIDEVFAEQVPEDKAGVLAQLRAEGRKIAFVGDGVNDGPAMVAADVGVAMSRGAELARATADVVLLEDRLGLLVEAVDVSQRTMRLIARNYRAAIGINTGVMIGAAMGRLSPVTAAILHNGTTVGLLLSALRGIGGDAGQGNAVLPPAGDSLEETETEVV